MKLNKVRQELNALNLEAFLFTNMINIRYLTGFTGTTSMVLIGRNRQFILIDARYEHQVKEEVFNFEVIIIQGGRSLLNLLLTNNIKKLGFESLDLSYDQYDFMSNHYQDVVLFPIKNILGDQRVIKSESELKDLKISAQIVDYAFEKIIYFIKKGVSERAIAVELERIMRLQGAENIAFKTIVASGLRSALPHGVASDKIIGDGEFLTLDYGCIYNGYCSDISRTLVIGQATEKQRLLYDMVLKAQMVALKLVQENAKCSELDRQVRAYFKKNGYANYFGHGLGHGIGLEVHENPRITEDSTDLLMIHTTIAIEPGIYIEQYGGVRIEDMVLVTEDGYELLTKAPKHLIEI